MPRIRSIKPDFFRHEKLQDLENENPKARVMLTFAGLWTLCDSKGRFEWKPRHIKLDILPFVDFNIEKTLSILETNCFISQYEVDGHKYGVVWTFGKHQRITGKELAQGEKYPEPNVKQQGNNRETPGEYPESQERERERERISTYGTVPAEAGTDVLVLECKPQNNGVPYESIRKLYNEKLNELPTCMTMTETRKKHLKTCWHQEPGKTDSMTFWDGFFDFIKESDFLMGRTAHKPFTGCNLEWITKIANFVKIREGTYNRGR